MLYADGTNGLAWLAAPFTKVHLQILDVLVVYVARKQADKKQYKVVRNIVHFFFNIQIRKAQLPVARFLFSHQHIFIMW